MAAARGDGGEGPVGSFKLEAVAGSPAFDGAVGAKAAGAPFSGRHRDVPVWRDR